MSRGDWKDRIRGLFGFGRSEERSLDIPHYPAAPLYPSPASKSGSKPASKKKSKAEEKKDFNDWKRYDDWKKGETYWKLHNETCKKGVIETDPAKRVGGIWMAEKESDGQLHLYMTCVKPKCAAVNDFSKHAVHKDGNVSPCIVCVKCQTHEFIKLEGWTLGEHVEAKTKEDLEWEKKWKDWKPSKDSGFGRDWKPYKDGDKSGKDPMGLGGFDTYY
jgi:hypothetical protein